MKITNVAVGNVGCKPNWSRLSNWLKRCRPDIVTLQKIGSAEPFPTEVFCKIDYESWFLDHNQNYLGVAVLAPRVFLSRCDVPAKVRDCGLPSDDRNESRFLTVSIGNFWVSSFYAPYGLKRKSLGKRGAIERRVTWLNHLRDHVCSEGQDRWVLCRDFNVKADGPPWGTGYYWQDEKDALEELLRVGFVDVYRRVHPCATKRRGWTRGYTEKDPTKGDARLHLILASKSLAQRLRSACVDVESKPWPRKRRSSARRGLGRHLSGEASAGAHGAGRVRERCHSFDAQRPPAIASAMRLPTRSAVSTR